MHDFHHLVYLDLQKTGSTFVSQFLNDTCLLRCEKEIKHGRITSDYRPDAYYFITIRHPLDQYQSLYRYGLDGKGGLYERIVKNSRGSIYKDGAGGFPAWLEFMLDPSSAKYFGEGYDAVRNGLPAWQRVLIPVLHPVRRLLGRHDDYSGQGLRDCGFLSFRFLMLSLRFPLRTLSRCDASDLSACLRDAQIFDRVIRQEQLNDGLRALATIDKPEFFDQARVAEFFRKRETRINASSEQPLAEPGSALMAELRRREKILFDYYP